MIQGQKPVQNDTRRPSTWDTMHLHFKCAKDSQMHTITYKITHLNFTKTLLTDSGRHIIIKSQLPQSNLHRILSFCCASCIRQTPACKSYPIPPRNTT